jgi:COP9 signalosome complex subunit 1
LKLLSFFAHTIYRTELQSQVTANIGFKEFLELVPELRDTIRDFYHSRYAACLRSLEALRFPLTLDMHLGSHVASLYDQIRERAVMQYVSPFKSVDLHAMAVAFNTTVG